MQLRIVLILSVVALTGCPQPTKPDPGEALQRQALAAIDTNVARPSLERFVTDSSALRLAVEAWRQAPAGQDTAALDEAKQKFEAAFLSWQRVELLQFGPLGAATRVTLGEGLRDEIYSWPTANLCRIDAALVANTTPDDAYFDAALVTSKGLVVLEELLHNQSTATTCPATATIVTDGSWAALAGTPALQERRKAWAAGVARHVERTAKKARDGWVAYAEKQATAGGMGSPWRTPKDALDDVFAGLFLVDQMVKDSKLGAPAGLNMACMATSCPELAESPRALLSSRAVVENLLALRAGFTGSFEADSTAIGFDDLLVERGATELRDQMLAALEGALVSARALDRPVQRLVVESPEVVPALRTKVKTFTDLFKTQFVTTLSLKVPKEGAGDND